MKVSCLMITTNVVSRLHLLDNAIKSVERCSGDLIDNKVLSIDMMPNQKCDLNHFKQYEQLGWTLVSGRCSGHRGMLNNMIRGLQNTELSDYIYYVEDDVVITRLPNRQSFGCLAYGQTSNAKPIGFACFNTHVNADKGKIGFINNKANYQFFGDELFLIKNEQIRDEYYLNFPSAFIKDGLFREMVVYAADHCEGLGMEPGLTKAWFDLQLYNRYDVATYVRPDTLDHLPLDFDKFYHMANMQFWNNDVNLRHPSINDRKNTIF
jgi:hypothetical protein